MRWTFWDRLYILTRGLWLDLCDWGKAHWVQIYILFVIFLLVSSVSLVFL